MEDNKMVFTDCKLITHVIAGKKVKCMKYKVTHLVCNKLEKGRGTISLDKKWFKPGLKQFKSDEWGHLTYDKYKEQYCYRAMFETYAAAGELISCLDSFIIEKFLLGY